MITASIFIGSSSEGLAVARAIKQQFDDFEKVEIWKEGLFEVNRSYLDSLNRAADLFDFAILCLTPDDITSSRGKESSSPRDNVLFELGLFMGRLGQHRAFIVADESARILSDFQGITIGTYRQPRDNNYTSAVGNACTAIRNQMMRSLAQSEMSFLPSTALAVGYFENFIKRVVEGLEDKKPDLIDMGNEKEPVRLEFEDYHLRILIPSKLSHLNERNLKKTLRKLKQVQIQTNFRGFPFYIAGDFEPGKTKTLELIDIPTTIRASERIIELIIKPGGLGDNDIERAMLEEKEIKNFRKALEYLIQKEGLDDNVSIEWL